MVDESTFKAITDNGVSTEKNIVAALDKMKRQMNE